MWMDTYDIVLSRKQELEEFLSKNSIGKDTEIIGVSNVREASDKVM